MNKFNVVPMHENHIDDVIMIERLTSASPWSGDTFLKEINSPTHIILVASEKEQNMKSSIIGFCGGQLVGDELHIHSLATHPDHQRMGAGREMIQSLLGIAKTQGANKATLEVRVSNSGAISLYEQFGFVSEGVRPNYYQDNGEDANIMWLHAIKVARQ